MKPKDLTGQTFGRLTAIQLAPWRKSSQGRYWLCRCECGEQVVVRGKDLPNGNTRSCGCEQLSGIRKAKMLTHNGKTMSLSAWAAQIGGTEGVVKSRINLGWPVEAAVSVPVRPHRRKRDGVRKDAPAEKITFGGLTLSRAEWSRRLGGPRYLVRERLIKGWSVEEAVTAPPRKPRETP